MSWPLGFRTRLALALAAVAVLAVSGSAVVAVHEVVRQLDARTQTTLLRLGAILTLVGTLALGLALVLARRLGVEIEQQQAAVARRNAELLAESETRRREAESLASAARMISEGRTADEVARAVAEALGRLVHAPHTVVYRRDPQSGELIRLAGTGPEPGDAGGLAVPLLVEGEVSGLLTVHDRPGRGFGDDDVRLAQAFAAHAAVALENARLLADTERRWRAADELAALARNLTASLSVEVAGGWVVDSALRLLPVESVGLRLLEPDGALVAVAWAGPSAAHFGPGHRLAPGEGLSGRAVVEGRTLASWDVGGETDLTLSENLARRIAAAGHRGLLVVPLRVEARILGVLSCACRHPRQFSPEDIRLAELFAGQAALGLERARLYAEALRRKTQAESLAATARGLGEDLDADAIGQRIVDRVLTVFGADYSGLRLRAPDGSLELVARAGLDFPAGHRIRADEGLAGGAFSGGATVVAEDYFDAPHLSLSPSLRREVAAAGLRSGIATPLRGRDRVLGALTMGYAQPRSFSAETTDLLTAFAGQAAAALDNAQLYAEARREHREAETAAAQLRGAKARLEDLSRRLLEVQESERRAIARELHDQIGQELTAVKLALRLTARGAEPEAHERLDEVADLVDDLIERVRTLSLDLRPAMLDDLGLRSALEWLIARHVQRSATRVRLEITGVEGRLPPPVETAAFRIVQEALTNVARHASAPAAIVRVVERDGRLDLEIVDNGVGFDVRDAGTAAESAGLSGMRERAALLGGRVVITSGPGRGTRVAAELPLGADLTADRRRA